MEIKNGSQGHRFVFQPGKNGIAEKAAKKISSRDVAFKGTVVKVDDMTGQPLDDC